VLLTNTPSPFYSSLPISYGTFGHQGRGKWEKEKSIGSFLHLKVGDPDLSGERARTSFPIPSPLMGEGQGEGESRRVK
jgi:hypothetical protein